MLKSITFEIIGDLRIICDGCEQRIEKMLKTIHGVDRARANSRNQRIDVLLDTDVEDGATILERLGTAGYQTKVIGLE